MTPVVYLDSSAITKLLVEEPERQDLRQFLESRPDRVTSIVGAIEVGRAVWRQDPTQLASLAAVWEGIGRIALDQAVVDRAATLDPPGLRTLDAIHLASALELGSDLSVLVTYDVRFADAARRQGIAVASPGAAPRDPAGRAVREFALARSYEGPADFEPSPAEQESKHAFRMASAS